ncbi:MAG: nucleotidyl transferase AbiEii/AbiGii toxin family protein, partial [Endomicrobiia bacterium]|nr:nucleotidyl transferase AbiEii/AbiGii toxin family protein [Endomicrobiia bacterium]
TLSAKGLAQPLKIDFVEDVVVKTPSVRKFNGIPVYNVKDIYLHKIAATAGTRALSDHAGRTVMTGRNEARDFIDLYYLSKKVEPLSRFLEKLPALYQMGMIHWYRTYSRHDFSTAFLDENVYDSKLTSREIIGHLDGEIKKFVGEAAGL